MLKVLDFYADWCAPCRALEPALHGLAALDVQVERVDADNSPDLCERYGVQGLPTLIVLQDDRQVDYIAGPDANARTLVQRVCSHREGQK
jgi:thioredoxin 1